MLIRRLDFDDDAEVHTAASFSLATLLESIPEFRTNPLLLPNATVSDMVSMYRAGCTNPEHRYLVAVLRGSGRPDPIPGTPAPLCLWRGRLEIRGRSPRSSQSEDAGLPWKKWRIERRQRSENPS